MQWELNDSAWMGVNMSLASIALDQILIMFLIIIIGMICYKAKLIDKELNKKLSNILLMVVSPLLIFNSYQREFSSDLLQGLGISFGLALASHLISILAAQVFVRGKDSNAVIDRFSAIYSNCGFIGIPLINGLVGKEGVFYITAYLTVFNVFVWTHGVIMMVGKQTKKEIIKTLISPTIIAIVLGMLAFLMRLRMPYIIYESIEYVASMNTPLAMLIAGVSIAQTNIVKVFLKPRIYLVVVLKLLLIPVLLLFLYTRLPINETVLTTALLGVACPTAATGTMFALRYNKDAVYASEIFAITTLASVVSIPAVMALLGIFL
jgi:predicted permease